jgi:hypothetical protein
MPNPPSTSQQHVEQPCSFRSSLTPICLRSYPLLIPDLSPIPISAPLDSVRLFLIPQSHLAHCHYVPDTCWLSCLRWCKHPASPLLPSTSSTPITARLCDVVLHAGGARVVACTLAPPQDFLRIHVTASAPTLTVSPPSPSRTSGNARALGGFIRERQLLLRAPLSDWPPYIASVHDRLLIPLSQRSATASASLVLVAADA